MFSRKTWKMRAARHSLFDMVNDWYGSPDEDLFRKIKSIAGQPSTGHPGFLVQFVAGDIRFVPKHA